MAVRAGLVLVLVLAVLAGAADARPTTVTRVARVIDGDTIVLTDGARVRLLQIDTPEPGTSECYSRAAGRDLLTFGAGPREDVGAADANDVLAGKVGV